jgi:hypothetical protein
MMILQKNLMDMDSPENKVDVWMEWAMMFIYNNVIYFLWSKRSIVCVVSWEIMEYKTSKAMISPKWKERLWMFSIESIHAIDIKDIPHNAVYWMASDWIEDQPWGDLWKKLMSRWMKELISKYSWPNMQENVVNITQYIQEWIQNPKGKEKRKEKWDDECEVYDDQTLIWFTTNWLMKYQNK